MKRKLLLTAATLLCGSMLAFGQGISFGPKVGITFPNERTTTSVTLPWLGTSTKVSDNKPLLVGWHAGVEAVVSFGLLEVEGNLLFTRRGSTVVLGDGTLVKGTGVSSVYYLDVPLFLNCAIPAGPVKVIVGVGPTFSFGLFGSYTTKGTVLGIEGKTTEKYRFGGDTPTHNVFDLAAAGQVGVQFSGFKVTGFFEWGFLNAAAFLNDVKNSSVTNYGGGISLAYLF